MRVDVVRDVSAALDAHHPVPVFLEALVVALVVCVGLDDGVGQGCVSCYNKARGLSGLFEVVREEGRGKWEAGSP